MSAGTWRARLGNLWYWAGPGQLQQRHRTKAYVAREQAAGRTVTPVGRALPAPAREVEGRPAPGIREPQARTPRTRERTR